MKTIRLDAYRRQAHRQRPGMAYLVGAGPGRADLITVRGLRLLQHADVLIYDRLIARELVEEARPDAELIFAGKGPGQHTLTQSAINQLLVDRVRRGKQVVRLKGGDPFVFGRGSEEALELAAAGLAFEIVPGVSSALAVPAYAGIPVTHRGMATAFAVVTGHECGADDTNTVDWDAMARIPTLVVLMGVAQIGRIAASLMEAGRSGQTPAAAISWGTTDHQQVVAATLCDLAEVIRRENVQAPAVIVIGDVAAWHAELDWHQANGDATGFFALEPTVLQQAVGA